MPTPSKFTADRRAKIIEALSVGASRVTAAHIAGVDEAQIRRWVKRGEDSPAGTAFRQFYEDVLQAEAHPKMKALGIIYREMEGRPEFAWKVLERREPGYAPPMPHVQQALAGPVVIQFSFTEAVAAPALGTGEVIEGEFVEQDDEPKPS